MFDTEENLEHQAVRGWWAVRRTGGGVFRKKNKNPSTSASVENSDTPITSFQSDAHVTNFQPILSVDEVFLFL